jgi:hypothetical protein
MSRQNKSTDALRGAIGAGTQEQRYTAKTINGRPEFQGNGNARHAGQRPPSWRKPAGTDAMTLLGALWGPSRDAGSRP